MMKKYKQESDKDVIINEDLPLGSHLITEELRVALKKMTVRELQMLVRAMRENKLDESGER